MAQYSDYLQYLQHVDDTTLQDFKEREKKLTDEMDAAKKKYNEELEATKKKHLDEIEKIKSQCQQEIKSKDNKYKKEIEEQKSSYETKIADIKQQFKDKESALNKKIADLKSEYEEELKSLRTKHSTEKGKFTKDSKKYSKQIDTLKVETDTLTHKANMYERLYNEVKPKLKSLSNFRLFMVILIVLISFGTAPILYFFYWLFNLKNHFSVKRWVQCHKYESARAIKAKN